MRSGTTIIASACVAGVLLGAAGCSSSGGGDSAARAAASSLAADPTYQAQVRNLEARLLANYQKDFKPAHPIATMKQAVSETFPGANAGDILSHAVKTFKLADRHAGPAQAAWMHDVVTFALGQQAQGVPSTSGQPSIPGVTSSPSKSPSPSLSHTVRSVPPSSVSPVHLTVHPGAFCSQAGETGVTNTGHAEVCRTSATDSQLRWRSA